MGGGKQPGSMTPGAPQNKPASSPMVGGTPNWMPTVSGDSLSASQALDMNKGNFDLGYYRLNSVDGPGETERNLKERFGTELTDGYYARKRNAPPTPEQAAMTTIKNQVEESARKRSASSVLTGAGLLEDDSPRASRVLLDG